MNSLTTQCVPLLLQAVDGNWLAYAGPGATIGCGVWGPTPDDARVRFAEEVAHLEAILQRAD